MKLTKFEILQYTNLMEFIVRMSEAISGIERFKKGKFKHLLNIELPKNLEADLVKGLLLFMGRDTDVSKDTFTTLTGLCYTATLDKGDDFKERTAQTLDDATLFLDEKEPELKEVYRFIEVCSIAQKLEVLLNAISESRTERDLLFPFSALCKIIHPKAMEAIKDLNDPWNTTYNIVREPAAGAGEIKRDIFDIVGDGKNGKEIYDKIYKMLDEFFIDGGLKKDEDFKTEKRKLEIDYELARHKYLEFKKQHSGKLLV